MDNYDPVTDMRSQRIVTRCPVARTQSYSITHPSLA